MSSGAVEPRIRARHVGAGGRRGAAARVLACKRPDWYDLTVLAVFAASSVWVLALDLWRTVAHGFVWTGINGVIIEDPLQYMAWIQDASRHLLVSDLFVLNPTPHDYLQPAIAISGALVAMGVAPWVTLFVWHPIAVVCVFMAVRAFIRSQLSGSSRRRVALVLALCAGSVGMHPDLWLPFWTWGYSFALLGLAAAVGSLLLYERAAQHPRSVWPAALLGGLASWLHPWLGGVLILVVGGAEAWMWLQGRRPSAARLAPALIAIALPLAYYSVLERTDVTWQLGGHANLLPYPVSRVALTLAPLAVPAVLAYRTRPRSFTAAAARVWPLAAVAVFLCAERGLGNGPTHAFLGISVPLAVLAVEGVGAVRLPAIAPRRTLALLAVLALTVPVAIAQVRAEQSRVRPAANRLFMGEWRAIAYLARDPRPGGVLTAYHLGVFSPAETGRRTYFGNRYWSQPRSRLRDEMVRDLFNGRMQPRQAQAFVSGSGALFVLEGCRSHARLDRTLAPIIRSVERFKCATVYELRRA